MSDKLILHPAQSDKPLAADKAAELAKHMEAIGKIVSDHQLKTVKLKPINDTKYGAMVLNIGEDK